MSDLIDRNSLINDIKSVNTYGLVALKKKVERAPAVDAAPVVHGRWEEICNAYGELEGWIHTDCGREVKCKDNFCPNCGARMDWKEDAE